VTSFKCIDEKSIAGCCIARPTNHKRCDSHTPHVRLNRLPGIARSLQCNQNPAAALYALATLSIVSKVISPLPASRIFSAHLPMNRSIIPTMCARPADSGLTDVICQFLRLKRKLQQSPMRKEGYRGQLTGILTGKYRNSPHPPFCHCPR
jgi:hypothetical protein